MDIGGYRTGRLLGRGGSGRVWAATAPDGSQVALKLFDGPFERTLQAARREVALAAQIDHPHVIIPRSVVCDAELVAVIAPLAAGGSLAALLERRGTLTPAETLTVLIPLAAVLATAHARGVMHGDLSPSNVVLDGDGRPLVTDLGAARVSLECGLPVTATPATVAPEVARGGVPDAAADVFAWGAVALQCLTGRPAWNALDLRDVVVQATVGQWPDPADQDGPAPLIAVIRAALGDVPARRPGAASIAVELRRCGKPAPLDLGEPASGSEKAEQQGAVQQGAVQQGALPRDAMQQNAVPSGGDAGRSVARHRIRQLTRARSDAVPGRVIVAAAEDDGRERLRRRLRRAAVGVVAVVAVGLAALGGMLWAGADAGRAGTAPPAPIGSARRSVEIAVPSSTGRTAGRSPSPSLSPSQPPEATAPIPAPVTPAPTPTPTPTPIPTTNPTPAPQAVPVDPTTSAAPPTSVDWLGVVRDLDTVRADALVLRDPAKLAAVYAAGAAGRIADTATIGRLSANGLRVSGAAHQVTRATAHRDGRTVLVTITDSLPEYHVLDEDGRVVGTTPSRRSATRVLSMVWVGDHYRIAAVDVG